jgi:hypothetical protein
MRQKKTTCEHCGGSDLIKASCFEYSVVQRIDLKTDEPIGEPKTFFPFRCLSFGKEVYL